MKIKITKLSKCMCIVLWWLQLWLLLVTVHRECIANATLQLVCQRQTSMAATNKQTCKRIQDSAAIDFSVRSVSLCQFGIFGCNQSCCLLPAATTCAKLAQTYGTHAEINSRTILLVFLSMFVCWLLSWYVLGILTPQLCIAHCGSGHSYTHCNRISMHMHSL